MHTGQQLHTKVINFYPSELCMALCISGNLELGMIERSPVITWPYGLRCYIHMEMDCCETGDHPSPKVFMKT